MLVAYTEDNKTDGGKSFNFKDAFYARLAAHILQTCAVCSGPAKSPFAVKTR